MKKVHVIDLWQFVKNFEIKVQNAKNQNLGGNLSHLVIQEAQMPKPLKLLTQLSLIKLR